MNKFIALRSGVEDFGVTIWLSDYSSQLKQQSFLFDKIGILWLELLIRNYKRITSQSVGKKREDLITELEWLQENEIIYDQRLPKEMFVEVELGEYFISKHNEVDKAVANFFDKAMESKQAEDRANVWRAMIERDSIDLRMLSSHLKIAEKVKAVTTLPFTEYARKLPNTRKTYISQVVINQFPLPDNSTPWEKIIDYRNDPENQKKSSSIKKMD
jgi:hypothetical protein